VLGLRVRVRVVAKIQEGVTVSQSLGLELGLLGLGNCYGLALG